LQRLGAQQRGVAANDDHPAGGERRNAGADCERVTGAFLLGLNLELDAVMRHLRPHAIGLVADHRDDAIGRRDALRGFNHVVEQARSSGAMQDLGQPRLHAGA
jgi:hypothetical protein